MTPQEKWTAHVEAWKDCGLCPLCNQRNKIVLARGRVPCDVLLVGEAPGDSENVLGRPFVGPAGKLLDQIVERGVPDNLRVAFTNLVACYPRHAKEAGYNEPDESEIVACQDRLREFVELCQPRLVVWVGRLAEEWGPRALKGLPVGALPRYTTCAVTHPAAILRMPIAQQDFAVRKCIVTLRQATEALASPVINV